MTTHCALYWFVSVRYGYICRAVKVVFLCLCHALISKGVQCRNGLAQVKQCGSGGGVSGGPVVLGPFLPMRWKVCSYVLSGFYKCQVVSTDVEKW